MPDFQIQYACLNNTRTHHQSKDNQEKSLTNDWKIAHDMARKTSERTLKKKIVLKVTENALVPIHNGLNRSFYTQFEIIDVRASSLYTIFFFF